ncbi:Serine/Threonine-Protein Kinase Nek3 [Manis pentadactyla]|nr:Serine/Threonine-Protein Kinase Nek3 [Manis pentadactyla]
MKHPKVLPLKNHLKILNWFVQMCLGVNHIHEKCVLHRDIKSKNIFLTRNGKVNLGDFGSACLLSHPMAFACTYVGTLYYVPPEIWENMPCNNERDTWAAFSLNSAPSSTRFRQIVGKVFSSKYFRGL